MIIIIYTRKSSRLTGCFGRIFSCALFARRMSFSTSGLLLSGSLSLTLACSMYCTMVAADVKTSFFARTLTCKKCKTLHIFVLIVQSYKYFNSYHSYCSYLRHDLYCGANSRFCLMVVSTWPISKVIAVLNNGCWTSMGFWSYTATPIHDGVVFP